MTSVPVPSRRVLAELAALYLMDAPPNQTASPVQRAFSTLQTLLAAQTAALAEIDEIAAELFSRFGNPRVPLLVRPGSPPTYATDPGTIRRWLGTGLESRSLTANCGVGRAASCKPPRLLAYLRLKLANVPSSSRQPI